MPAEGDDGWGGSLSTYLIALATGSLTKAGGTFSLTADVNFGTNFGLKTQYIKSQAANPSSTGVIRLGNNESIGFRNAANSADLLLTLDASNLLQFNGSTILLPGLANIVNADISAIAAIAYSKLNLANSIVNVDIASAAAIDYSKLAALTANRVLVSSAGGAVSVSATTTTTLGFLDATSSIQTQLNTLTSSFAHIENVSDTYNLGLSASVAAGSLTVALKQKNGSDPSTGLNQVIIGMRSNTATSGVYTERSVTGALSLTLSGSANLGCFSNAAVAPVLFIYAIDSDGAGTMKLGLSSYKFPDTELQSTRLASKTFTVTIASPGVFTSNSHGLTNYDRIQFTTTGALPTGLSANTNYYIVNATTNTFNVSATPLGTAINTTGTQSGTHTVHITSMRSIVSDAIYTSKPVRCLGYVSLASVNTTTWGAVSKLSLDQFNLYPSEIYVQALYDDAGDGGQTVASGVKTKIRFPMQANGSSDKLGLLNENTGDILIPVDGVYEYGAILSIDSAGLNAGEYFKLYAEFSDTQAYSQIIGVTSAQATSTQSITVQGTMRRRLRTDTFLSFHLLQNTGASVTLTGITGSAVGLADQICWVRKIE